MYHTIESLANSLGVSTLIVQRRAVRLGIWTRDGIADEDVFKLEFLRETKVEEVTATVELTVEPQARENENTYVWYGEFADGKPIYRRANERPASKGTVASTPSWSRIVIDYMTPTFKVKGDKDFNSIAR